jgi:peptide/nickel transport system ATP-binding protein
VDGLTVCFDHDAGGPGGIAVVRNLGFTLNKGETLCLVGESGCGKSMAALSLLRLTPPDSRVSGRVTLSGVELTALSEEAMRRVRGRRCAMIFQEPMTSLNPVLRIGDQIAEPLIEHCGATPATAREQALQALREVGMPAAEQRLRDYPHQLSGGMRQRVMIAMALICGPDLLLADEPTTALDVTIQGQILALLRERTSAGGMGLVLITHDLGVVAEAADTVGVMYAGEIVEQAPVARLFAEPLHPYTLGLMGAVPGRRSGRGARLATIPGIVPAPGALPPGCAFAPRCGRAMPVCAQEPPLCRPGPDHQVRCWLQAG